MTHSGNNSVQQNPFFFPFFLNVEFSISAFPWKTSQSCWISTYSIPPKKVYWQVASNIFPKARIKPFVNPFLPSSHKNSNRNSHPTPSWKLRESVSETSSDHGTNRKRQYGVTVWQKKPHLTWQWRQAMTQLSQRESLWTCSVKHSWSPLTAVSSMTAYQEAGATI